METDDQLLSQAIDCLTVVIERMNVDPKTEYLLTLAKDLIEFAVPALGIADEAA